MLVYVCPVQVSGWYSMRDGTGTRSLQGLRCNYIIYMPAVTTERKLEAFKVHMAIRPVRRVRALIRGTTQSPKYGKNSVGEVIRMELPPLCPCRTGCKYGGGRHDHRAVERPQQHPCRRAVLIAARPSGSASSSPSYGSSYGSRGDSRSPSGSPEWPQSGTQPGRGSRSPTH